MILAGDVGGTKTVLAVIEPVGGTARLRTVIEREFRSKDYPGLQAIADEFLALPAVAEHRTAIERAGFGVAGPVRAGGSHITNLGWEIEERELARGLGMPVVLVNDLVATAHGIPALAPESLATLQLGQADPEGGAALIAAGTGLGMAVMVRARDRLLPSPSEGGHADFAPRTDEEVALFSYVREHEGRVEWEHLVSGPGLVRCYDFTHRDVKPGHPDPHVESDPAAAVSRIALTKACPACVRSLDLFVGLYGAAAGNLALTVLATGGMYVGGGIAPKILPALEAGFARVFAEKGAAFGRLLARIPIQVILDPRCALYGAALAGR